MPARYVTDLLAALGAHGDRPAVVGDAHHETFAELLAGVHRTARALHAHGLARGDGLVLLAANTPDTLRVRLAAYLLGLRFTHVHQGPTTQPVAHIVADAAPVLVLYQGEVASGDATGTRNGGPAAASCSPDGSDLADGRGRGPLDAATGGRYDRPGVLSMAELAARASAQSADPLPVAAEEGDIARVTYTGGTTGLPKGVPTTYAALHAAAQAAIAGAAATRDALVARGGRARFLAVTPIAHVAGDMALMMLSMGFTVEVFDFSPDLMLRRIAAAGDDAVLTYLYPPLLYRLLDHPDLATTDTAALSFVVYGSSPMSPTRLREAIDRFGPIFQQGYASTEAPAITALTVADHLAGMNGRPELLGSVGRALPGVELAVRDAAGKSVPAGALGEVCVRSASVMPGYWNSPAATADVLDADGWLHTGDLGRLSGDGYLFLVGRTREMIIVNGWNCYAVPIEAALTEHPAVRAAAVIGVPDDHTGEAIVAYIVADTPVAPADLRTLVTTRVNATSVPTRIEYLDALPLTAVGKPDKESLRQHATR